MKTHERTLAPRLLFGMGDMSEQSRSAVERLRADAVAIKRFDSLSGASPSLEEIHLPGGWVVGLVDGGRSA